MWQPLDDPHWNADRSLSFVPGSGPYLVISGWLLMITAPIGLVVGAPQVARIHGSLTWLSFVLLCVGATIGGMTVLVQHRRFQRRHKTLPASIGSIPASDLKWGFRLLGVLAISFVVVFFIRCFS